MKDVLSEDEVSLVENLTNVLEEYMAAVERKDERKMKLIVTKFKKVYKDLQYFYIDPEELDQLDPFEKAELEMQLDEEADEYLDMYKHQLANHY